MARDFKPYRDELIISKAGYNMWDGPDGEQGSRKNLIAAADQSLKRLGFDYVDMFYSHRFDPKTPLEAGKSNGRKGHLVADIAACVSCDKVDGEAGPAIFML